MAQPQIPYAAIAVGIGVLLGIWAFIEAESEGARIFIVAAMVLVFLVRVVWPGLAGQVVSLVGWTVFGIGCFVFIKWRGVGIR